MKKVKDNKRSKCDGCINFLKMKSLNDTRALCTYFDCRIHSDKSAQSCKGFKRFSKKREDNENY